MAAAAAWRPASSDARRHLFRIPGSLCPRSLSAHATAESAARCPPSSQRTAPPPCLLDRTESPSVPRRPQLQFSGAFSRSPSGAAGWWRRLSAVSEPARSLQPGWGKDRQFSSCAANPRDLSETKRHLYVVVADHEKGGYSIHKLDIDDDLDSDSSSSSGSGALHRRLSGQPAVRTGPPSIGTPAHFAALGSYIIASSHGVTLIYDTKTAPVLTAAQLLPSGLRRGHNLAVAVRNRLYLIESCTEGFFNAGPDGHYYSGALHCLAANRDNQYCLTAEDRRRDEKWNWRQLPDSSGFSWSWSDQPSYLRFDAESIIAHAVHPRGRTIFVSAVAGEYPVESCTYAYGTGSGKWRRCGAWMLPFKGQAHYDGELDAWVGLHRHPDGFEWDAPADGHLCACSVTSAAAGRWPPGWKVGREKLFLEDRAGGTWTPSLLFTRVKASSTYCLVERLRPEGEGPPWKTYGLRLTTFRVKNGDDGELVTVPHRPAARFYEVPSFVVQAFWM